MAGSRDRERDSELDAAILRRRLRPFAGVGRVRFGFEMPEHEGVIRYAADIDGATIQVRQELQQAAADVASREADLSQARQEAPATRRRGRSQDDPALDAVREARERHSALDDELSALQSERMRVDHWLRDLFAHVADAVHAFEEGRRLISPPDEVEVFGSEAAFVAENSHRGILHGANRMDAGGMDFGHRWRRFGDDSIGKPPHGRWRVSWIAETGEIYAVLRGYAVRSEVWLIASGFHSEREVWDLLTPVEHRQPEPNSLLFVTRRILARTASRTEPHVGLLRRAARDLHRSLPPPASERGEVDAVLAAAASLIAPQRYSEDEEHVRRLLTWIDTFRADDEEARE